MTLREGEAETFKAGVHLGLFGLAVACLGYNLMAFSERKDRHLVTNVAVYSSLAAYEWVQIIGHWRCR